MARPEADGLVFPEGPRWHDGRLWFSDIHGHRVYAQAPGEPLQVVAELDQPSGLGFLPDGTPLVAAMRDKMLWRLEPSGPAHHADLSAFDGDFLNDMAVDGDGRAYVGCRHDRTGGGAVAPDAVIGVEPDGRAWVAAADMIGPNGTVITPDGGTVIVAETHAFRLTAFDRGPDGRLSGRRCFATLPDGAHPDGICLDAEGAVWAATGSSGLALRIAPGGAVLEQRQADGGWLTACVLGGPGRRTLYATVAATTMEGLVAVMRSAPDRSDEHRRWATARSAGAIVSFTVDVPGAGVP